MTGEFDTPEGHDPTLEQTEKVLDDIITRYKQGGDKTTARADALAYARSHIEHAKAHPGEGEMPDGSDAADYEIKKWQKAIADASAGNWGTFREEFQSVAQGFIQEGEEGDDPEWTQIGRSFKKLAESL